MAADEFVLDVGRFNERLGKVVASWEMDNTNQGLWEGADVLVFAAGKSSATTTKEATVQNWFFDIEMPDVIMVVRADKKIVVCASKKKVAILQQLAVESSPFTFEFLVKAKGENTENIGALVGALSGSREGERVGICGGEKARKRLTGKFVPAYLAAVSAPLVDIQPGVAAEMVVKSVGEVANVTKAAKLVGAVFERVKGKIEDALDRGSGVTHAALATGAANAFGAPGSLGLDEGEFPADLCDFAFLPVVLSGKSAAAVAMESDNEALASRGPVIVNLGGRYALYSAAAVRTLLVNASESMARAYKDLTEAHAELVAAVKPGVTFSALHGVGVAAVESRDGELAEKLGSVFGSSMGLDVVESEYMIAEGCNAKVKEGMVLHVALVVQGAGKKKKRYGLSVSDTVVVTKDGCEVLTGSIDKNLSYTFASDEAGPSGADLNATLDADAVLDDRLRRRSGPSTNEALENEARLREHQAELAEKTLREAMERYSGGTTKSKDAGKRSAELINVYSSPAEYPRAARADMVYVDDKSETVFLPVYGVSVPFHVSTIKSATKTEEGDYVYVRFNFVTPGGKAKQTMAFENETSIYLKEVSFRVRVQAASKLNASLRRVLELRKRIAASEKERRERADLVKQPKLQVTRHGTIPRLTSVEMRPKLSGRKEIGTLEAHDNGLRFTSRSGQRVDIIYANIRHAFFQPSESELLVLIHFHLFNPIMIGKKKSYDVQFYQMAYNVEKNLAGGSGRSAFDMDELEDEQRERESRRKKNVAFKRFADAIESVVEAKTELSLEFDIPYRELGFNGVPMRSTVFLQPTVNCLVHLVETPFVVISLADIEIVHFERVRFSLRNFDMVIVWKDYSKPVQHINSIEAKSLDPIKDWLDENQIKFYEGQANLNWTAVMKHITDDVPGFFTDGGWSFLDDDDAEEEDAGGDSDESEFEASGDDDDDDDEYEFESGEGTDDSYDIPSDPEEDLSEEGLTFEELEAKARRIDMKKRGRDDDDDDRGWRSKRSKRK